MPYIAPSVEESATSAAEFKDALRRVRRQRFTPTDDLPDTLASYVHSLRLRGRSCEDTIVEVGAQARLISPCDTEPSEGGWEDYWRRYYAFYDKLIERTVRAYVLDEEAEPALADTV